MGLTSREIGDENRAMLERQRRFRLAADYVAKAMGELPEVTKVALFGSAARELREEVPRFGRFRRAGVKVLHEMKDVDLAVWVADLSRLRALQRARSGALNLLLRDDNVGVAHHQVDVFVMEPGTDRYLGRLCKRARCPSIGEDRRTRLRESLPEEMLRALAREKPCLVPGCGDAKHLRLHDPDALDVPRLEAGIASGVVLFESKTSGG
jgi:hypothetical protein